MGSGWGSERGVAAKTWGTAKTVDSGKTANGKAQQTATSNQQPAKNVNGFTPSF
jgi:hypothetical protein